MSKDWLLHQGLRRITIIVGKSARDLVLLLPVIAVMLQLINITAT